MIDLHVHTTVSDGALFPLDVVRLAAARGLQVIAITDHNSVLGIPEAVEEGVACGVEIIPGVELSAAYEVGLLHILGYCIHFENVDFQHCLAALREERVADARAILASIGKPRLGAFLSDEIDTSGGGECGSGQMEAQGKAQRCTRFVSGADQSPLLLRAKLLPAEAIRLIKAASGVPIVAHPYSLIRYSGADWNVLLKKLVNVGIEGVEAYPPSHTPAEISLFERSAQEIGLLVTGGSDFHGRAESDFQLGFTGSAPLSYQIVEDLKDRAAWRNVG